MLMRSEQDRGTLFQMECLTRGETPEGRSLRTYRDQVPQYPPHDLQQSLCRTSHACVGCQVASLFEHRSKATFRTHRPPQTAADEAPFQPGIPRFAALSLAS